MRFSSGTIVDYYLIINKLYSDDRRNSKHPTYIYIHTYLYINMKYNTYMHHLDCRFIELQLKLEVRKFAKFFSKERKKICYFLVKLFKTNSFLFIYYSYLIIVNLHNLYTFNWKLNIVLFYI